MAGLGVAVADLRKGEMEQKTKWWFLPRDVKLALIPSRMSILIICVLLTSLGIIFIISHLSKRRRSQRNRRGK